MTLSRQLPRRLRIRQKIKQQGQKKALVVLDIPLKIAEAPIAKFLIRLNYEGLDKRELAPNLALDPESVADPYFFRATLRTKSDEQEKEELEANAKRKFPRPPTLGIAWSPCSSCSGESR